MSPQRRETFNDIIEEELRLKSEIQKTTEMIDDLEEKINDVRAEYDEQVESGDPQVAEILHREHLSLISRKGSFERKLADLQNALSELGVPERRWAAEVVSIIQSIKSFSRNYNGLVEQFNSSYTNYIATAQELVEVGRLVGRGIDRYREINIEMQHGGLTPPELPSFQKLGYRYPCGHGVVNNIARVANEAHSKVFPVMRLDDK